MISKSRLEELERAERKLNALEAGGVDNWEWFDESLKELHSELTDDLIHDLELAFGECAYEPSERGAGIAFGDDIHDAVKELLSKAGVTFKECLDNESD